MTSPIDSKPGQPTRSFAYSIGTLMTDPEMYAAMRASFEAGGFSTQDCEFLVVDNTREPQTDAYSGLNRLLTRARGEYVILCHQDVLLLSDGRAQLDARLSELTGHDPNWAIAGNAGAVAPRQLAIRISDFNGDNQQIGSFPAKVVSVDENFMIVRRSARVGFSNDLSGFHLYGADLCMVADMLGYNAYVIDFHLRHFGLGKTGPEFERCRVAFRKKWAHALRDRKIRTTCTYVHVARWQGPEWIRKALERRSKR